jgi:hypothetical protein
MVREARVSQENNEIIETFSASEQSALKMASDLELERSKALSMLHEVEAQKDQLIVSLNATARPPELQLPKETQRLLRDIVAKDLPPAASLHLISVLFPERIVLDDDGEALQSARDCKLNSNGWTRLFGLLWLLATEYYEQRYKGLPASQAGEVFSNYAENDSIWSEDAKSERTKKYRGDSYLCVEHLKIGVLRDKQYTARIYFKWIRDLKGARILIGHCGEHLS